MRKMTATQRVNSLALQGARLTAIGFNVSALGMGTVATFSTPEAARAAVTDAIRAANTLRCR